MRINSPVVCSGLCLLAAAGLAAFGALRSEPSEVIAAAQSAPASQAKAPSKPRERFDMLVRDDFFAGMFAGDKARFERALKFTEEALAKDPKNADALVWHGSALQFLSGEAYAEGDDKMGDELRKRGIKEMDDAVAMAPQDIGVRIGRGAPLLGWAASGGDPDDPESRALIRKAVSDYEFVFARQRPKFQNLSRHSRGELLFGLAQGWGQLGDKAKVRSYLEEIVKSCPDSPYEKEAKSLLAQKPLPSVRHDCIGCHVN